jgi:hypothetical protein
MIKWLAEDRDYFDRVVSLLVKRYHPEWEVTHVNGKGGDTGLDVVARDDASGKCIVYQLKFFPEGLAMGGRKTQVARSLRTALTKHPEMTAWILVVPCTLTPGQDDWLHALAPEDSNCSIGVWDETDLDSLLARFPDIYGYVKRTDELLESARELNLERAVLADPARDTAARVAALYRKVNETDPDFYPVIYADENGPRISARAKHANATQRLKITFVFPPGFEEYRETVEDLACWGVTEVVELPPEVVGSTALEGPSFLMGGASEGSRTKVTVEPHGKEKATHLRILNGDHLTVGAHPGSLRMAMGVRGATISARFHDAFLMRWRIPSDFEEDEVGLTTFTLSPTGLPPSSVVHACHLLRQLLSNPAFEIDVMDEPLVGSTSDPAQDVPDYVSYIEELAEDLEVVQRSTGSYFPFEFPDESERVALRVARLLLEGKAVHAPPSVVLSLQGDSDAVEPGSAERVDIQGQTLPFTFCGKEVAVRGVSISHPGCQLSPSAGEDASYVLVPLGEPFLLRPDTAEVANPTPWGLPGIPEPHGYSLLREPG